MADVVVAIPTFRRPQGLGRLLGALANLETQASLEVVVADNDVARHEGFDLCRARAASYRWPLSSVIAAERGIAQARNGAVEYALARSEAPYIAMLDDDEWVEPGWLDGFLRVARETEADALRGTVLREFEIEPDPWAAGCKSFRPLRAPSGPVSMIEGAGNVLIRRRCFDALPFPWFDPAFALSGGEDRDFFTRLRNAGARFAWAEDAICHEHVPASRANLRWALKRSYRVGNSDMRVFLKYAPAPLARAHELLKIAGAVALYPLLQLALAPFASRRADPLCTLYRAAGKAAAVAGRFHDEYATIHGG